MRRVHRAAGVVGTLLFGLSFSHQPLAAPWGAIDPPNETSNGARAGLTQVGDRCPRWRDCYNSRPSYGYYAPRFEPSVVYFGPSGIYRPYPPIVVYDFPAYDPYYSSWRPAPDYYHYRRW
jgi:hypothetical protein